MLIMEVRYSNISHDIACKSVVEMGSRGHVGCDESDHFSPQVSQTVLVGLPVHFGPQRMLQEQQKSLGRQPPFPQSGP